MKLWLRCCGTKSREKEAMVIRIEEEIEFVI